ncbi:unnamed protein product [Amoebophrya sp. A120]|nr:unnamed protein product [Amoebophrya sp. A120]|eukprot:GSA120T00019106001.1
MPGVAAGHLGGSVSAAAAAGAAAAAAGAGNPFGASSANPYATPAGMAALNRAAAAGQLCAAAAAGQTPLGSSPYNAFAAAAAAAARTPHPSTTPANAFASILSQQPPAGSAASAQSSANPYASFSAASPLSATNPYGQHASALAGFQPPGAAGAGAAASFSGLAGAATDPLTGVPLFTGATDPLTGVPTGTEHDYTANPWAAAAGIPGFDATGAAGADQWAHLDMSMWNPTAGFDLLFNPFLNPVSTTEHYGFSSTSDGTQNIDFASLDATAAAAVGLTDAASGLPDVAGTAGQDSRFGAKTAAGNQAFAFNKVASGLFNPTSKLENSCDKKTTLTGSPDTVNNCSLLSSPDRSGSPESSVYGAGSSIDGNGIAPTPPHGSGVGMLNQPAGAGSSTLATGRNQSAATTALSAAGATGTPNMASIGAGSSSTTATSSHDPAVAATSVTSRVSSATTSHSGTTAATAGSSTSANPTTPAKVIPPAPAQQQLSSGLLHNVTSAPVTGNNAMQTPGGSVGMVGTSSALDLARQPSLTMQDPGVPVWSASAGSFPVLLGTTPGLLGAAPQLAFPDGSVGPYDHVYGTYGAGSLGGA